MPQDRRESFDIGAAQWLAWDGNPANKPKPDQGSIGKPAVLPDQPKQPIRPIG